MPTPRVSIDNLPSKGTPETDDSLVIQDSGVTKKTTIAGLLTLPSTPLTAHLANTVDAHDATAISTTDSGNGVNGVTVQAQLGQAATIATNASTAAAAAQTNLTTHINKTPGAHAASAISAASNPNLTGVDVQAQLTSIGSALAGGGITGPPGPTGPTGPGVPVGGSAGTLLSKIDGTNYNAQWIVPLWVPTAGGTMTGPLVLPGDPSNNLHATTKSYVDTTTVSVGGDTMTGLLVLPGDPIGLLHAATKGYVDTTTVSLTGDVMSGNLQVGGDPATPAAGVVVNPAGLIRSTVNTTPVNVTLRRWTATAFSVGQKYINFTDSAGGTEIGSVSIASGSSVAYNTTSDERLKTFTREVDDDEALAQMRALRPLHFTWNSTPDDGEQIGFFAQEVNEVTPEAVTPGVGEPGDEDFVPWGMDNAKLVPLLVAAMQAMDAKIDELRTELAALRA